MYRKTTPISLVIGIPTMFHENVLHFPEILSSKLNGRVGLIVVLLFTQLTVASPPRYTQMCHADLHHQRWSPPSGQKTTACANQVSHP